MNTERPRDGKGKTPYNLEDFGLCYLFVTGHQVDQRKDMHHLGKEFYKKYYRGKLMIKEGDGERVSFYSVRSTEPSIFYLRPWGLFGRLETTQPKK